MVMRSRATNGRSATKCQGKQPDQADRLPSRRVEWWQQSAPRAGLVGRPEKRKYSRRFGVHLGNVGSRQSSRTSKNEPANASSGRMIPGLGNQPASPNLGLPPGAVLTLQHDEKNGLWVELDIT